jgi:SAM-dependent methyltransferase
VTAVATERGACPLCGIDYPHVEIAHGPDFEYRTTGNQEFRLTRCTRCRTIVLNPRPADTAIASLYPPEYEPYRFDRLNPLVKAGRDFVQRSKTRLIARYVPDGGTVVDVGCGGGALLKLLRAQTGARFRLIGWDYPGPHLDALAAEGIATIAAPLDSSDPPGGVDLFVLNQVIEHVPDPDRLIRRLAAALKPGGYLLIETPNTRALDARWFGQRYWGGYHIPRHMVLFDEDNLRSLVEHVGLRVVERAHLASPAFWVQSLHHWFSETRLSPLARACVIRNAPLVAMFVLFDTIRARLGSGTSNQRLVAQRAVP